MGDMQYGMCGVIWHVPTCTFLICPDRVPISSVQGLLGGDAEGARCLICGSSLSTSTSLVHRPRFALSNTLSREYLAADVPVPELAALKLQISPQSEEEDEEC